MISGLKDIIELATAIIGLLTASLPFLKKMVCLTTAIHFKKTFSV
jgi:hypothetical protein